MSRPLAPPFRPRLTLRQMMKLVAFGAVASACLAPALRLVEGGVGHWTFFLLMEAVVIPLALALVAFPLVRKGLLKDWLIRALLMCSVGVALGWAVAMLVWVVNFTVSRGVPVDYPFLSGIVVVIFVLGLAFTLLLRRAMPGHCPECKRLTLLPDALVISNERAYRCLCCEGRFWKFSGSWKAVPPEFDPLPSLPDSRTGDVIVSHGLAPGSGDPQA
jgi:hypothetical protein